MDATQVGAILDGGPIDIDAVRAFVRPRPDEAAWTQIPWIADLWEGRSRAADQNQPIFLWAMNGHPLGCT